MRKFVLSLVKPYWKRYLIGISALFLVNFTQSYIPGLIRNTVNGISEGLLDISGILNQVVWILVLALIMAIGRWAWRIYVMGTSRIIECDLREKLYLHLETLSQDFYNQHKTGDLMAHATNDVMAVRQALGFISFGCYFINSYEFYFNDEDKPLFNAFYAFTTACYGYSFSVFSANNWYAFS